MKSGPTRERRRRKTEEDEEEGEGEEEEEEEEEEEGEGGEEEEEEEEEERNKQPSSKHGVIYFRWVMSRPCEIMLISIILGIIGGHGNLIIMLEQSN